MEAAERPKKRAGFKELFLIPLTYPLLAVILMWSVQIVGDELSFSLSKFGLKPRSWEGLAGIFTMPFLHGSYQHLINNSGPILVLGWALYKFYPTIALRSVLGIWFIGGLWLWISGRDAFHIGASGIVYGLASFLFLSGWLRKERSVAALSLVIVFVYGSLWWGVLPVNPQMSWEGHFWGAVAGFSMAFYFRKKGPQRPLYQWEKDEILEKKREQLMETMVFEEVSSHQGMPEKKKSPQQLPGDSQKNVKINYEFRRSSSREGKEDSES